MAVQYEIWKYILWNRLDLRQSDLWMNKRNWITILPDGTVQEAKILDFLDISYDLIEHRKKETDNTDSDT